jgi:hypothetical protein
MAEHTFIDLRDKEHQPASERIRPHTEYIKHLTTLSTGSIVVIAAFAEKISLQPTWKFLLAASLVSFVISILGSALWHTGLARDLIDEPPLREDTARGATATTHLLVAMLITTFGFVIGVVSLAAFAIRNLL